MFKSFLVAVLVAAAVAVAPGAAAAKGGLQLPVLRVAGTHGYEIDVWEFAGENKGPEIHVSIFNRRSQTVYSAPGHVSASGFSADFGHFGWVDVHWEPGPQRMVKDCHGSHRKETGGRFTGAFVFHGERRFSEADYPNLDVGPLSEYQEVCLRVDSGGVKGVELEALTRWAIVQAIQNRPGARVRFTARTTNTYGKVTVDRYLEAFGPSNDFAWSFGRDSAHLTPPAPFGGEATYRASRSRDKWRGDLSVHFPGFPRYPLAVAPTDAFFGPGSCKVHGPRRVFPPPECL